MLDDSEEESWDKYEYGFLKVGNIIRWYLAQYVNPHEGLREKVWNFLLFGGSNSKTVLERKSRDKGWFNSDIK